MEFLVYLSHDEGSQSYDLHHMFLLSLYCAVGTGFQLSHFWLHSCIDVMSCTVCTANAQSKMTNSDEEESYYFLSCNISLTLTPQLYRSDVMHSQRWLTLMQRSHIISFHVMFLSHWLHSCIEMSPEHSISDCALWENWILEMYIRRAETSSAPGQSYTSIVITGSLKSQSL